MSGIAGHNRNAVKFRGQYRHDWAVARVFGAAASRESKCPFCGHFNSFETSILLCGGCHRPWMPHKQYGAVYFGPRDAILPPKERFAGKETP